jgi:hypothetical protein
MSILDRLAQIEKKEIKEEKKHSDINVPEDAYDRVSALSPHDIVKWEWRTGEYIDIRVEVLSYKKHQQIRLNAAAECKKLGLSEGSSLYDLTFNQEISCSILYFALKNPTQDGKVYDGNIYEPAFSSVDKIKELTPTDIEKLLLLYETVRDKFTISNEVLFIKENMDAWIEKIALAGENDARAMLSFLSAADLVGLNQILCNVIWYLIICPSKESANTSKLDQVKLNGDTLSSSEQPIEQLKKRGRKAANTLESFSKEEALAKMQQFQSTIKE